MSGILLDILWAIVAFVVALIVSMIIIWAVTNLLGEREGLGAAFVVAIIGAIIYGIVYLLLGNGLFAALLGGIAWLIILKFGYNISWLKAILTAVIIWIVASIVGYFLPTLTGPL